MDFSKNNMKVEILDKLYKANCILELCRGYALIEEPEIKILENTLFSLTLTYTEIYNNLCEISRTEAQNNAV